MVLDHSNTSKTKLHHYLHQKFLPFPATVQYFLFAQRGIYLLLGFITIYLCTTLCIYVCSCGSNRGKHNLA